MIFKDNRIYDWLKWIAMVGLPAIACLWFTVGKIWGFPYLAEVEATIVAIDTFLGALLGISNIRYNNAMEGYLADGKGGDDDGAEE
jgi:hypothetical protein